MRARTNQGGLTLVEIMIAMAVGSLLIGMIFAIYTKMSVAYRSQSRVTEVNQTVRAAAAMIARDVALAGYGIPDADQVNEENLAVAPFNGAVYNTNSGGPCDSADLPAHICTDPLRSLYVINGVPFGGESPSANDPDQLFMYAGDQASASVIESFDIGGFPRIELEYPADTARFAVDDLILVVRRATADLTNGADGGPPNTVIFTSCIAQVTSIGSDSLRVTTASSFNITAFAQCQNVFDAYDSSALGNNYQFLDRTVYKLWARGYRIDPDASRRAFGVLQVSRSGGIVANDWEDIALGVTNLQFATQYLEVGDANDRDGDGDATLDWYSGDNMAHPHTDRPDNAVLRTVSISIEGRTTEETDSVGTQDTPSFGGGDFDQTGDVPAGYDLSLGSQPSRYQGNHAYRWTTTRVDIRNSAVGR